jgi:tetratricopeptide (TPR) repeat protein
MAADGDYDAALASFGHAIEQDPGAIPAYFELARVMFQIGEVDSAIEVLASGVAVNEEAVDLRLHLMQALVVAERWDEALPHLDWLLEHTPDLAEPHAYFSIHLAINTEDMDGAQHHATEALRLGPESPEAHFAMGVLHWKKREFRRARVEFERARRSPGISPILRERIQFFLDRMDQPESNP